MDVILGWKKTTSWASFCFSFMNLFFFDLTIIWMEFPKRVRQKWLMKFAQIFVQPPVVGVKKVDHLDPIEYTLLKAHIAPEIWWLDKKSIPFREKKTYFHGGCCCMLVLERVIVKSLQQKSNK